MRQKRLQIITLVITTALLIMTGYGLFYLISNKSQLENRLHEQIRNEISGIKIPLVQNGKDATVDYEQLNKYIDNRINQFPKPQDGQRGVDGEDGFDGMNGLNGGDGQDGASIKGADGSSCSAQQLETGAAIVCTDGTSAIIQNGKDGQNGNTPDLRCNESKNRWEVRYHPDESYAILNGKVTPCKAGVL